MTVEEARRIVLERRQHRALMQQRAARWRELKAARRITERVERAEAAKRAKWIQGRAMLTDSRLPMVGTFIAGPRRFDLVQHSPNGGYDFEPDVRELILPVLALGQAAMWSDPREQLGLR